LRITAVAQIGGDIRVSFASVSGKYYCLDRCDSLGGGWTNLVDGVPGNNGIQQITDIGGASRPTSFYRVRLSQSTGPGQLDSVGDGILDSWRTQYFGGDGTTTNNLSCAACDPDGDGMSNLQEYLVGTDPTNRASAFLITSVVNTGADILVTWTMGAGKTNALQVSSGDANGSFTNAFTDLFSVTNTVGTQTNYLDIGGATNVPSRFYRVRLVP
jgi:hypothetical protein